MTLATVNPISKAGNAWASRGSLQACRLLALGTTASAGQLPCNPHLGPGLGAPNPSPFSPFQKQLACLNHSQQPA